MSQSNLTPSSFFSAPTYGPQWLLDLSWLFWAIAILFAVAGLYFLWRSLLRDADRHKRRCPKCWYDMTGVTGLRCPECGREHASERKLFKRRRKRFHALAALLLLLFAISTALTPRIAQRGWLDSTPTLALIAASYIYDTDQQLLYREAGMRILKERRSRNGNPPSSAGGPPSVSRLSKSWFIRRAKSQLMTPQGPQPLVQPVWSIPGWFGLDLHDFTISVLSHMHADGFEVESTIIPALHHSDLPTQRAVLSAVTTNFDTPAPPIREAIRDCLRTTDQAVFNLAAEWLARSCPNPDDIPAIIIGARRHTRSLHVLGHYGRAGANACADLLNDPDIALYAARVLRTLRRDALNLPKILQAAKSSTDPAVRAECVMIFAMWSHYDADARAALADILTSDPNENVRLYALSNLSSFCNSKIASYLPAPQVVPSLIRDLSAESSSMRLLCALNLASFGPDTAPALPALQAIIDNPNEPERLRKVAADTIAAINTSISTATTSPASALPPDSSPAPVPVPSAPSP